MTPPDFDELALQLMLDLQQRLSRRVGVSIPLSDILTVDSADHAIAVALLRSVHAQGREAGIREAAARCTMVDAMGDASCEGMRDDIRDAIWELLPKVKP